MQRLLQILRRGTREERLHLFFQIGMIGKGVDAILEMIGSAILLGINRPEIITIVRRLTAPELSEDPGDPLANYLNHAAKMWSGQFQAFVAFYLLSHGVLKAGLIVGLLRRKMWMYPVAIGIFLAFAIYQIYAWVQHHSPVLVILLATDIIVIGLTSLEYKRLKTKNADH